MFERLKHKWKVSGWRLLLILITFAVGGSLTGLAGRKIMFWTGIESSLAYIPVYILVVSLLWPISVLLVSIPFGQFRFFLHYLQRLFSKLGKAFNKN